MHHPTDRMTHTTAFVTPVIEHWLEWEIAQWVHHEGSIQRPIAPWANTLTTELHLAPLWWVCMNLQWIWACKIVLPPTIFWEQDVAPWYKHSLMVLWVIGSILHGGPIELFLVPASAPRQRLWHVLSCLWDDAYKTTLTANQKE